MFSVNVVVGSHDIEILVVTEDASTLSKMLMTTLGAVPGVRRLTPALAMDVLKNRPDWVPFHEA